MSEQYIQDRLFEFDEISTLPISIEVYRNLVFLEKLRPSNKARPPVYATSFLGQILEFIVNNAYPYSPFFTTAMKTNCREFLSTFEIPSQPEPLIPIKPELARTFHMGEIDYLDSVLSDPKKIEHFRKPRIWWQGRFNGPPHPGYIETLILLKDEFPETPITVVIDPDSMSRNKNQPIFLNSEMRASLFLATGMVDQVLLAKEEMGTQAAYYWAGVHSYLKPKYVLNPAYDEVQEVNHRDIMSVFSIDIPSIPGKALYMHGSELRDSKTDPQQIHADWNYIREILP